jgi:class 3 adenylate cyclase
VGDLPTGTVTFLFTDIERSTLLWEQDPTAMRRAMPRHGALLRHAIETHGGSIFKTMGDQFCAAFNRPTDALFAVLEAQRALTTEPWPEPLSLRVGMALHTGAVEVQEGEYSGTVVIRAARLVSFCHGGQVLLSQTTADLVQDDLPLGVSLRHLGSHRLRDLQRPEQMYQLVHPDLPSDFPPPQAAPVIPAELSREELLNMLFELHRRLEAQKERRAFLSIDVVDGSQMKRSGSSIAVERSFGQFRQWVEQAVHAHGGEVQYAAGDGVMCLFPSDATALRAARQLQEKLPRFNAEHNRLPLSFQIRCGVSAGEVAIEEGVPLGHLQSAIIDRAAALQKRAEPGGILLSGEVAAAALIELGPLEPLGAPVAGEPAFEWKERSL